ncbi:MAG: recombinase family protein [Polyangiaceae bacterium]|nr:recombinase family protein [Polyangiaceae bacterium]
MKRQTSQPSAVEAPKRCAIYTRKSTSAGLDQAFNSLDAQRDACLSYVARQAGWTVVPERYDDGGFTGANTDRPAFQRLMNDVDAGAIDVIVVYKVDRLSRSLLDFVNTMERLAKAEAAFVSVTQNFSTADAMGRLTMRLLASFAEFEREMISERTRDKIVAARKKGHWTGGPVPLGYRLEGGKLVIDDAEAAIVRDIFREYAAHRSLVRIVSQLNGAGRTTKQARRFTKDAVLRVLKNPIYAGFIAYGGERYAGEHDVIIPEAELDRVLGMMTKPARVVGRGAGADHLLRGLVRCGGCGAAMTVETTRNGRRTYRYVRCGTYQKKGAGSCPTRARVPAAPIEEVVVGMLRDQAREPAFAADVGVKLRARLGEQRARLEAEAATLPRTIGEASSRVHSLGIAVGDAPDAARRVLTRRLDEESEIVARQEDRLATVRRELHDLDGVEAEVGWIEGTLKRFDAIWDVLTEVNRVRLVRALVRAVVVDAAHEQVHVELATGDAGARAS